MKSHILSSLSVFLLCITMSNGFLYLDDRPLYMNIENRFNVDFTIVSSDIEHGVCEMPSTITASSTTIISCRAKASVLAPGPEGSLKFQGGDMSGVIEWNHPRTFGKSEYSCDVNGLSKSTSALLTVFLTRAHSPLSLQLALANSRMRACSFEVLLLMVLRMVLAPALERVMSRLLTST